MQFLSNKNLTHLQLAKPQERQTDLEPAPQIETALLFSGLGGFPPLASLVATRGQYLAAEPRLR